MFLPFFFHLNGGRRPMVADWMFGQPLGRIKSLEPVA
jgi:hypothetical protein